MIRFTSTKLATKGKKGILTPDENGYYSLVVGGLNAFNSVKQYYTLEGAKQLFQDSSTLMRRIQNGAVKCEVGHPKKLPGMSDDDYFNRILTIEETNVCAHIAELWLDFDYHDLNHIGNGRDKVVAIWAKLKPAGPFGPALAAALTNPQENVFFSIRSFTKDYSHHLTTYRVLKTIVTFDWVTESGIATANKWDSPSLECLQDISISMATIRHYIDGNLKLVGLESGLIKEEARQLLQTSTEPMTPSYLSW